MEGKGAGEFVQVQGKGYGTCRGSVLCVLESVRMGVCVCVVECVRVCLKINVTGTWFLN